MWPISVSQMTNILAKSNSCKSGCMNHNPCCGEFQNLHLVNTPTNNSVSFTNYTANVFQSIVILQHRVSKCQ